MSHSDRHLERDLCARCLAGDQDAWFELEHRYKNVLKAKVAARLNQWPPNKAAIDDLTQEVWARLSTGTNPGLRAFDPSKGRFETFLDLRARDAVCEERRTKGPVPYTALDANCRRSPWRRGPGWNAS